MKLQYWYIIGIVVLIIIIVVMVRRKNNGTILATNGNGSTNSNDTTTNGLSITRKEDLKLLASRLKSDMSTNDMKKANAITDEELIFLNSYYNNELSLNSSLWTNVDDALRPFTSEDELLMNRLERLGLK